MKGLNTMNESIKILDTCWIGSVGIVLAENSATRFQVARMAPYEAKGLEQDIEHILDWGHPLDFVQAVAFFPKKANMIGYNTCSDALEDWFVGSKLTRSWLKDKQGNGITSREFENLLRQDDYRVVKQEMLGECFVSTVWLGSPHGCSEPYDYFETIVFRTTPGCEDPRAVLGEVLECHRYPTIEEAEEGHKFVVKGWRGTEKFTSLA